MSRIVHKDERLVVSHGDYSDYQILAIVEANKSFDVDVALQEFQAWLAPRDIKYPSQYHFLAWLLNVRGLVREVSVNWREWHLGDYGFTGRDYRLELWRDGRWDDDDLGKYDAEEIEESK